MATGPQRQHETPPLRLRKIRGERRKGRAVDDRDACFVELLVFDRGHPVVPVAKVVDGCLCQQALYEPGRTWVVEDAREVLAADEVNVVDTEVGRDDLIAGRSAPSRPFDDPRSPPVERVRSDQEGLAVGEARLELRLVCA